MTWITANHVRYSPDGKYLVAALNRNDAGYLYIWDSSTWELRHVCSGHKGMVDQFALSPDGKHAASGCRDSRIRLWDLASGALALDQDAARNEIFCIAWSQDGKFLATGHSDCEIHVWEVGPQSIKHLHALTIEEKGGPYYELVQCLAISPDSAVLAIPAGYGRGIGLWNLRRGRREATLADTGLNGYTSLAFSPESLLLAAGTFQGNLKIWDLSKEQQLCSIGTEHYLEQNADQAFYMNNVIYSVVFSPDGNVLLAANGDYSVCMWDRYTQRPFKVFKGHGNAVYSACFSPDGKWIVSGSHDQSIRIWNAKTGHLRSVLPLD